MSLWLGRVGDLPADSEGEGVSSHPPKEASPLTHPPPTPSFADGAWPRQPRRGEGGRFLRRAQSVDWEVPLASDGLKRRGGAPRTIRGLAPPP